MYKVQLTPLQGRTWSHSSIWNTGLHATDITSMDNLILRTIAGIASKNSGKSHSEVAVECERLHCKRRIEGDYREKFGRSNGGEEKCIMDKTIFLCSSPELSSRVATLQMRNVAFLAGIRSRIPSTSSVIKHV